VARFLLRLVLLLVLGATTEAAAQQLPALCSEPSAQLEDPFAILNGRSFYRPPAEIAAFHLSRVVCRPKRAPFVPALRVVVRISSDNFPKDPLHDEAQNIVTIWSGLPGDGMHATFGDVQRSIGHAGFSDDPVAAAFLFKYLYASDRDQVIATDGRRLSMSQIVAVTQYLGFLASLRYDYSKQEKLSRPIVSSTQVTDAAAAALAGTNPTLLAGDCADVANAQGQLLEKLGAQHVVVATSSFLPGLHSTVIAKDPQRQSYFHFNYGMVSQSVGREGPDLLQVPGLEDKWVDIGSGIYLNQPGGRSIAYVPTNAGKLYAEVAGMDIHELEPLARANSSLVGAQLELPGNQSLQLFTARDSTGSYYGGLALTQSWAQRSSFPGAIGLVTAARSTAQGLSVADLYLHIEQRATTRDYHLGGPLFGRLDAAAIIIATYALPFSDLDTNTLGFGAAVALNTGAQLTAGTPLSVLSARLRVEVQVMPGLTNVGGSTPTVFLNHVVLTADGRARVGHSGAGPIYLVAGSAVVFDELNTRLALGVGVENPRFALRLEGTGRALEDDATYKEGSLRRGRLIAGYSLTRFLRLSALGEVVEADADRRWTVTGAVGVRF
jgi:hypothetical protein